MRYFTIPTISFTGADGVTRATKDLREIPSYTIRRVIRRQANEMPDYTVQRQDALGPGQEPSAFLLWEANHVALVELAFDWSQMQTVNIPVERTS